MFEVNQHPSTWSTSNEHPTQPSLHSGPNMKCLTMSWLRPSNRSAERLLAVGPIEHDSLVHFDPWQGAPFGTEPITQASEFLFLAQKLFACGEPLVARNNLVCMVSMPSIGRPGMYSANRSRQLVQPPR